MARPTLLTVDDEPGVARAVERDLKRQYGERFRVLRAESGDQALDLLGKLKLRGDPLALMLVDQRMPRMSGVEFMERAMELEPAAKRVLLTAYADTEAAIRAINEVGIDHYLLKPWDPPEQQLYPIVDDLLDDWEAEHDSSFGGPRVIGHRWSAKSHDLKDFLARNQVPYKWLEVEQSEEAERLLGLANVERSRLPVVLFDDGAVLEQPSNLEVAEKIGLSTRAELPFYDLAIVGGGPAGLAAGVYGASEGLRTVLIEREAAGGQAGQSSRIENYLGFPSGLSGAELTRRAAAQARRFGAEMISVQEVCGLEVRGSARVLRLTDGAELSAHAIVVATGVSYRKLDAPGADRLAGRGVYYGAAMTEALSCRDQDVYLVGGANSAGQAAMYFAQYARSVTILVRSDALEKSMSQYLVDRIEEAPNIAVRTRTQVAAVHGEDRLEGLTLANGDGPEEQVPASTLFVFIGAAPRTDWVGDAVARDDRGFIYTGPDLMNDGARPRGWHEDRDPYLLESSVPGLFVAGDVRHESVKRVASAVGEGAMAVQFVHQYLARQ